MVRRAEETSGLGIVSRLPAIIHGGILTMALALVPFVFASSPSSPQAPNPSKTNRHWAFSPVQAVPPPAVKRASWPVTTIDRFILARLEAERLPPARPATREQLIRRVSFDLTGLPPSPEEVQAFAKDRSPSAWTNLVEQLLSSPHYGERWARHWLDVVRYAESDGFEHDAVRPNSWRYRDYVIQSLNADKPYDRFIQEQIAGDELWPDDPQAVIATAFNLLGPDMVDSSDQVQRRLLTLSDMTDTTSSAFLGLTMGCARCHDHKLEPFSQADYYSLQSFFAPAQFYRDLPVPTEEERARHQSAMTVYRERSGSTQRELDELEQPYRDRLYAEKLSKLSEDVQVAHQTPKEQRTAEQQASVLETAPQLQIADAEVVKILTANDKAKRKKIEDVLKKIPKPAPLPTTLALRDTNGPAPVTRVLRRGDYNHPVDAVEPAFPVVLQTRAAHQAARPEPDTHRRARLARWLTDPSNPLTARVMVNRIWQHHFGRGLVTTPSDFGTQGARPSHPELLDWLAVEFMARGWSIKNLHRLILFSAAYQQSSEVSAPALNADPENQWFSRQNRARMEGEVLRDSLLFISGRLNVSHGGPSVLPPIAADIVSTSKNWNASKDPADHHRRSIYIFARRNLRFPFLEVFDAPDSNLSCAMRGQSTTAPQSLTLLNSTEVMQAATGTARRLVDPHTADGDEPRIGLAFRLILGREPERAELKASRDFVRQTRERSTDSAAAQRTDPPREWVELCRALFNLNDFVYVD